MSPKRAAEGPGGAKAPARFGAGSGQTDQAKEVRELWTKYLQSTSKKRREAVRKVLEELEGQRSSGLGCQALAKVAFLDGAREALQVRRGSGGGRRGETPFFRGRRCCIAGSQACAVAEGCPSPSLQ